MKNLLKSLMVITTVTILSVLLLAGSTENSGQNHLESSNLVKIKNDLMINADEFYNWHRHKSEGGPTYSGSPSWHRYMKFIESKLEQFGVVDLVRNSWNYDRWYTTEWPYDSNWNLISDGDSIKVAHYGSYSGSTGANGITAELIYYDPTAPPLSIQDKIVVIKTAPHPNPPLPESYKQWFTQNDYEYQSDNETFPALFSKVDIKQTVTSDVWYQLYQTLRINKILREGKAAGGIIVFDMSYDRLAGLYTFPVPVLLNIPIHYVDRLSGTKLIRNAKESKTATLKLLANSENVETYQLIGYLPGKYYGTAKDEQILLTTHTDGPSISQENGPLGILGIVSYFSQIPKAERLRTLMVYFDNRHYMPGMERGFAAYDWFTKNPEAKNSIVSLIAAEHLGQMEYMEDGNLFYPTGMVEPSILWTRNNPWLIEKAIKVVKENKWPRVSVQCVEKTGIHNQPQGIWYGLGGNIALDWDIPAFATMGTQGAYWATTAGLNKFNKKLFYTQVKSITQLTGYLMIMDIH